AVPSLHRLALANLDARRLPLLFVDRVRLPGRVLSDPRLLAHSDAPFEDEPRGNEDRSALLHEVRRLLVEERAVLDRPASRAERGHDAGLAVAVGRDDPVRPRRLRDDRLELLPRELSMDRMVQFARDPARREDLDDPRPDPELHSDPFQALGHSIAK